MVRPANLIADHINAVNRREEGAGGDLIKNFRQFTVDPRGDLQLARSSTQGSGRVEIGDARPREGSVSDRSVSSGVSVETGKESAGQMDVRSRRRS